MWNGRRKCEVDKRTNCNHNKQFSKFRSWGESFWVFPDWLEAKNKKSILVFLACLSSVHEQQKQRDILLVLGLDNLLISTVIHFFCTA